MGNAELYARGAHLQERARVRCLAGDHETAGKLLAAAARDYACAGRLEEQARVCLDLADLHDRRGDLSARDELLFDAFVAAAAGGDRHTSSLALERLPLPSPTALRKVA